MAKDKPTPKAPQNQKPVHAVPLLRTVVHHQFNWAVEEGPEGSEVRQLVIQGPNGEQHIFPFGHDIAEKCGNALAAPSVQVASPADVSALRSVKDPA